jgi:four helix bundle protein
MGGISMQRPAAKTFEDLLVWQKSHEFVLELYRYTSLFPKNELYGLVSQMRRAAVSIPANIAEGFKKRGLADKIRFINIAQGSLEECRYFLILAQDLKYGESQALMNSLEEISRMMQAYQKALKVSNS